MQHARAHAYDLPELRALHGPENRGNQVSFSTVSGNYLVAAIAFFAVSANRKI
jgi:hypothetical protein